MTDEVASHEGSWDTKDLRMTHYARYIERKLYEAQEKLIKAINDYETAVLREHRMQEQRDTLAEALTELLDALGATRKPHELIGYGIAEHRAQEIVALAAVKGGEA